MGPTINYATADEWRDCMKNRSRYKITEIIARLGLRRQGNTEHGIPRFDNEVVKHFVADITAAASNLPEEREALTTTLASPNSLEAAVNKILETHGERLWGRTSRAHLHRAGSPDAAKAYEPRDLYFDNEDDREYIRILIHWWIGNRAANVIRAREEWARRKRKRGEPDTRPTDAVAPLTEEPTTPAISRTPIGSGTPVQSTAAAVPQQYSAPSPYVSPYTAATPAESGTVAGQQSEPVSGEHSTPTSRDRVQIGQSHSKHDAPFTYSGTSDSTSNPYSLAALNSKLAQPWPPAAVQSKTAQPREEEAEILQRGVDTGLVDALRSYVYHKENFTPTDEEALLQRVETYWRDTIRTNQNHVLGSVPLFAARDEAILTWIEMKRNIAEAVRLMGSGDMTQERRDQARRDIRVRQAETLRETFHELIRNWAQIGQGLKVAWAERLSAEELLVQAFVLLAGGRAACDVPWPPVGQVTQEIPQPFQKAGPVDLDAVV